MHQSGLREDVPKVGGTRLDILDPAIPAHSSPTLTRLLLPSVSSRNRHVREQHEGVERAPAKNPRIDGKLRCKDSACDRLFDK